MATLEPQIQKGPPAAGNPNQPPLRIIENLPAKTLAAALANGQKQVDKAK
jgi:hypothetical protein